MTPEEQKAQNEMFKMNTSAREHWGRLYAEFPELATDTQRSVYQLGFKDGVRWDAAEKDKEIAELKNELTLEKGGVQSLLKDLAAAKDRVAELEKEVGHWKALAEHRERVYNRLLDALNG